METCGIEGLATTLRHTCDAVVGHLAFRSFAEASGASVWALAEVRRYEGGSLLFDLLTSSWTGVVDQPETIGPCADDDLLEEMWRAREPLEIRPTAAAGSVAEIVLTVLRNAGNGALTIFPVNTDDYPGGSWVSLRAGSASISGPCTGDSRSMSISLRVCGAKPAFGRGSISPRSRSTCSSAARKE